MELDSLHVCLCSPDTNPDVFLLKFSSVLLLPSRVSHCVIPAAPPRVTGNPGVISVLLPLQELGFPACPRLCSARPWFGTDLILCFLMGWEISPGNAGDGRSCTCARAGLAAPALVPELYWYQFRIQLVAHLFIINIDEDSAFSSRK